MTFSEDSLYKEMVDEGTLGKEFQDRVKLGRILQKYKDLKTNYANNIKFDPTAQNLSKNNNKKKIFNYPNFRFHHTLCSPAVDPDLLRHCDL